MSNKFTTQDFVIAISAEDFNPTMLNADFLKYSGIVPIDWELSRAPIYNSRAAQIVFTNGVNILAEGNRIIFAEPIINKSSESLLTPSIVKKYAQTLLNMTFDVVGISLRGYISFDDSESARSYISANLLSNASWQVEGMRASLNLVYECERTPLYLTIAEAALQEDDDTTKPIVMFTGRYNYQLTGETSNEKRNHLYQVIENTESDLIEYSQLINNKFVQQELIEEHTAIEVPNLFAMAV
jgi:hypothetical protein